MAITGVGDAAAAAWDLGGVAGTESAGPLWLRVLLPLLVGAALVLPPCR